MNLFGVLSFGILIALICLVAVETIHAISKRRGKGPYNPNRTYYIIYDYECVGELLREIERLEKLPRRVKDGN